MKPRESIITLNLPAAVESYGEAGGMLLIDPAYETMDYFMDFLGLFFDDVECTANCPVPNVSSREHVITTNSTAPLVISYDQGSGITECSLVPGEYVQSSKQLDVVVNNLSINMKLE